ncbi:sigma-54-dependent transcriptional regulator [Marichromatium gracile]|uniref:Two-component system response regulator n=1 Tax=Marichromatium gracile TaxID=1048 RepID=A0ABR5VGR5_MARGR|nr:sigma-54 dependent transcriptional regulator [Marichromatium gracile]KXX64664.1 two-component system response regulator [Marichromatium gracile]
MPTDKAQALVVDDETDILELLRITLARMEIRAVTATSLVEARARLAEQPFDLCLTDMKLPDGSGIELIRHIAAHHPELPVAMITAYGNMDSAIEAMKAGAFDFVSKPVELQRLRQLVGAALKLAHRPGGEHGGERVPQLLGDSLAMAQIRQLIAKLARSQAPVFVTGESGTGKELAARLIHAQGPRRDGPFVALNCGAIPHDLVESELFGHKKGSFTGASSDKQGLFQAAEGGTLFLDEVAELPLQTQVKLLRAIQEKAVRPLGTQRELPVDVRLISASHRDLNAEVERGRFRQDLFYRINVIELRMPPLRERRGDIPALADWLLARIAEKSGADGPLRLAPEALAALARHPFPGNVRELENILERATALCEHSLIEIDDLYLPDPAPTQHDATPDVAAPCTAPAEPTHWDHAAAARRLGMSQRSLHYRLTRLGIE